MDKSKLHPVNITSIPSSAYLLGKEVSGFRYDKLTEFLVGLHDGIKEKVAGDYARNRSRLANLTDTTTVMVDHLALEYARITDIFHKYLKNEYEINPRSEYYEKTIKRLNDSF